MIADRDYLKILSDQNIMALMLTKEAASEPAAGKIACGHTVLTRIALGYEHYGDRTIKGTILQPWQYSCFNKPVDISYDEECVYLAGLILDGLTKDPTNGATHYFNPDLVVEVPESYIDCRFEKRIGRHIFYKPRWG